MHRALYDEEDGRHQEKVGPRKWIQKSHMKKGALHEDLDVPEGKKIPKSKLKKAEHSSNPKIRRRARLAETLKSFH